MKAKTVEGGISKIRPVSFAVLINSDGTVERRFVALPRLGIYIISFADEIIRVGECSSGTGRFQSGFCGRLRMISRGKDRKNYRAYHWRDNYRGKSVTVDYFTLTEAFSDSALRRALEAELTFQLRIAHRRWPREMSEIHFLERFRKNKILVNQLRRILSYYGLRYDGRT